MAFISLEVTAVLKLELQLSEATVEFMQSYSYMYPKLYLILLHQYGFQNS